MEWEDIAYELGIRRYKVLKIRYELLNDTARWLVIFNINV